MLARRERLIALAWYTALAIAVLEPLLRGSGFALLLDWTPTPDVRVRADGVLGVQEVPLLAILKGLSVVVPTWLLQRLILFAAVAGAGLAAHFTVPVRSASARFFAGTLYAINPFMMTRLIAGHWRLLLAYALAPFAARAVLRLVGNPSVRGGVTAGAWVAGLAAIAAHGLLFGMLLLVGFVVATVVSVQRAPVLRAFGAAVGVIAVGVMWWVLPAAMAERPARAGVETLDVFASASIGSVPVPVTILGMRGFWIERFNPTMPPGWWLLGIALALVAIVGTVLAARDHRRRQALTVIGAAAVGAVLAIGVATELTEPIVRALYRWIPGLVAFREPHKFVALLVVGYAWLGAIAVDRISDSRVRAVRMGVFVVAVALPLVLTPGIFGGAGGRIVPRHYPDSWAQAERVLRADPDEFRVLSLPWKLYMALPFADPREPVANPLPDYFSVPVIASQDPQLAPDVYVTADPASRTVERLIARHRTIQRFGAEVARLGVKYVVLIPEPGSEGYAFLYDQRDLEIVVSSPGLILFRNSAWSASSG